jgi:CheY-like chemotaxis protein
VGTVEQFFIPSSFALARAAITSAALHHPDRPATRGLAAFHRLGEALVRLAETEAGRGPDVIVCDYQLSRGMTGVDAIERLRSAFGKIPALLVSADATSPPCEVGPRAYDLLYKPVNAERFHAALVGASVLRVF